MNTTEKFYPETKFGGFTDIDGTIAFFNRVNSLLESSFVILDVGCGRGAYGDDDILLRRNLRILKGKVSKVIGIDVDQDAKENPYIDEFHLIQGNDWPVTDNSIDLIVCDNVMEHIDDPDRFFAEVTRVLKDGGLVCIRTPNRWSYVALTATLIPNKLHSKVTAIAQDGRKEEDVFPTLYKCNSKKRLKRMLQMNGFEEHVVYGYEPEPAYLSFSQLAYFFGFLHQRFAPACLKPALFAFGRINKKAAREEL